MLKTLPLVFFWSVLLLKEQMMTSVRKTVKMLVWSAQNRSTSGKICLENNHKIGRFLRIAFWWSLPRKLPRNRPIFPRNLSPKIRRNLTFSSATCQEPWHVQYKKKPEKNQGFNGIRTRDLRVTCPLLYQLSYEATHWERGQFIEFISPLRSEMMWSIYEIIHFWTTVVDESEEWSSQ